MWRIHSSHRNLDVTMHGSVVVSGLQPSVVSVPGCIRVRCRSQHACLCAPMSSSLNILLWKNGLYVLKLPRDVLCIRH